MNLRMLRKKVRSHARDFNETIFRREDIDLFVNEGIDRIIQVMPQLQNIPYLEEEEDTVAIIPREYTHLLANYAVARLMSQDERHYEATTFMNEFEVKLAEFKEKVDNEEIELLDPDTGNTLTASIPVDYVTNEYFHPIRSSESTLEESTVNIPPVDEPVDDDDFGDDDDDDDVLEEG